MSDGEEGAAAHDTETLFIITVNGRAARCELVAGLDGVHDAFLRTVWSGPGEAMPHEFSGHLESLRDPAAWAVHGEGDGLPFWHWWAGLGDNSVSVQRLTVPVPLGPRAGAALEQAAAALRGCAAELRLAAREAGGPLPFLRDKGVK
ncbi:MAG TPA: hypothetical protein VIL69_25245 [Roseomonas sp.]